MKKITIILSIAYLFSLTNLMGQNCKKDSLLLNLTLENDTIYPLNGLAYFLTLTNKGSQDKVIETPWAKRYVEPVIEFKNTNDSIWYKLPYPLEFMLEYEPDIITLVSNEKIQFKGLWLKIPRTNFELNARKITFLNRIFTPKSTYEIRAKIKPCKLKGERIYSNTVLIHVKDYEGIDKAAFNWLNEKVVHPAFIFAINDDNGYSEIHYSIAIWKLKKIHLGNLLEKFIINFPNSSFTPFARFCLIDWHLYGLHIEKDKLDPTIERLRFGKPRIKEAITLIEEIKRNNEVEQSAKIAEYISSFSRKINSINRRELRKEYRRNKSDKN